jgi:hypothetical protein
MKGSWRRRLSALEQQTHFLFMSQLLDEWIESYQGNAPRDYWKLWELVPLEIRAECLFRAFDQKRDAMKTENAK